MGLHTAAIRSFVHREVAKIVEKILELVEAGDSDALETALLLRSDLERIGLDHLVELFNKILVRSDSCPRVLLESLDRSGLLTDSQVSNICNSITQSVGLIADANFFALVDFVVKGLDERAVRLLRELDLQGLDVGERSRLEIAVGSYVREWKRFKKDEDLPDSVRKLAEGRGFNISV